MDRLRQSARHLLPAALNGLTAGIVCFGLLLVVELASVGSAVRGSLGSPLAIIIRNYLLAGAVAGTAAGLGAGIIAARIRRRAAARPVPRVSAGGGIALAACVASVAWTMAAHRAKPEPVAPTAAPNVVFILVDALRADRLSSFGYGRATSPHIDRFANEGTAFTNAYSHGNRTIIAMPSLFTSQYPSYARDVSSGNWSVPLPDSAVTLAEWFERSGYSTIACMSNPYLKRPFGLTQGFDRVEEFNAGRFHLTLYRAAVAAGLVRKPRTADGLTASATEVSDAAISAIDGTADDAPFFCYVHYMDVHHPYLPPAGLERAFCSDESLASIDPQALFAKTVGLVTRRVPYPLDAAELTRLSDLYDGCIRYVDSEIARVLQRALKRNHRPTIVVITSDHGDEFQEHGCLYHNNIVIEELIRVPLILWRSDRSATVHRVEHMVRHVDVLPTLLEWARIEAPANIAGRSLVPLVAGEPVEWPTGSFAEGDFCGAVVEPGWKLVHVDTTDGDALYDLAKDRAERLNVAAAHPGRRDRMRELLEAYYRAAPAAASTPAASAADEETLRQLKALGYVN